MTKKRDLSAAKGHLIADQAVELADALFAARSAIEEAQAMARMLRKAGAPLKSLHLSSIETLLALDLTEATGLRDFQLCEVGRLPTEDA